MKAIKNLIISLVVIVAILGVAVIGGYIYVRSTYGIDLFRTAEQLKILTEDVDEASLCPNAYGEEDFVTMKSEIDKRFSGLIVYEKGKGYNGYSVNFASLAGKSMTDPIFLTEKQVDFSEFAANGSADFNVVAKIDLTPFKADMGGFPYKYFKKYIPDNLYVSSTVRVDKTEEDGFAYTVTHKSLTLNNLSADNTADLFDTLNAVLKIGTAENLNMLVGTMAVNSLIGTKDNPGFAYSMKAIGAKSFDFGTFSDIDLFVVY